MGYVNRGRGGAAMCVEEGRNQFQRFGLRFPKKHIDFSSRVKSALLKTLYSTISRSVSKLRFFYCAHTHTAQALRHSLLLRTDRLESLRPTPRRTSPRYCGRRDPSLSISSRRLPPLDRLQIRAGKISDTAISSPTPPPLAWVAHRIRLTQHGDQIALFHLKIDACGGGLGGGSVVVEDAAEVEFGGVDDRCILLLVWRKEVTGGGELLLTTRFFRFLGAGEGADQFAHQVGEAEDGDEEHYEWFL